jgi:hypothetical protein
LKPDVFGLYQKKVLKLEEGIKNLEKIQNQKIDVEDFQGSNFALWALGKQHFNEKILTSEIKKIDLDKAQRVSIANHIKRICQN